MTDRPVILGAPMRVTDAIFSFPMVLALLGHRKTNTRRLAFSENGKPTKWLRMWERFEAAKARGETGYRECVWVRETWTCAGYNRRTREPLWVYAADHPSVITGGRIDGPKWKPSIHMQRRASRLTLVVTEVRRQRLQQISNLDAEAEGVRTLHDEPFDGVTSDTRRFELLWKHLHGAGAWAANPEVVALTFTVHGCNIDAMERAAA